MRSTRSSKSKTKQRKKRKKLSLLLPVNRCHENMLSTRWVAGCQLGRLHLPCWSVYFLSPFVVYTLLLPNVFFYFLIMFMSRWQNVLDGPVNCGDSNSRLPATSQRPGSVLWVGKKLYIGRKVLGHQKGAVGHGLGMSFLT
ncbi:hypothetical protein LZ32DRAFT_77234 [Colletotrichum eremochloae]|nr:hypothetical protein LZ32DRAFT_77234 [Colletotrichum eremochloae]